MRCQWFEYSLVKVTNYYYMLKNNLYVSGISNSIRCIRDSVDDPIFIYEALAIHFSITFQAHFLQNRTAFVSKEDCTLARKIIIYMPDNA